MKHKHLLLLITALFMAACAFAQPVIKTQRAAGGGDFDIFSCMTITHDGGVLAGGSSRSNISGEKSEDSKGRKGTSDYWIVKYDNKGNIQWDKTIGGASDEALARVQQTADGGYILGGQSNSNISGDKTEDSRGGYDYWIVKLDSAANIQWDKTIGGSDADQSYAIQQTTDGGYILGGYSSSNISGDKTQNSRGSSDYWIVKLDSTGNIQWDKTIGSASSDIFTDLQQTSDGGYIMGGFSESNISGDKTEDSRGSWDYWIVKLDNAGNTEWDKTIGGNSGDNCSSIQQTSDGGYILGGYSISNISGEKTQNSRGESYDYWIVKLDAQHNIEWDRTVGGDKNDFLQHIEQTRDGNYITCGTSWSNKSGEKSENTKDGNGAHNDYWIVLLNAAGRFRLDKTIGSAIDDNCFSIKESVKNNFVVGGYTGGGKSGDKTEPNRGLIDYWLVTIKYNSAGGLDIVEPSIENAKPKKPSDKGFSVYPNPVKDILHIQTNGKATVTLTDQQGKTILTKTINGNAEISVANLPAGLYYLKNNSTGATQKVTIAK